LNDIAPKLRWIAWFDLFVTALFVLPAIAQAVLGALLSVESLVFGLARVGALPTQPWSVFVSLMGVLGVVWAIARLIVLDDRLCWIDAIARIIVALILVQALLFTGLPHVFWGFVGTELLGSVFTLLAVRRATAA
jgi:hypothetical protein